MENKETIKYRSDTEAAEMLRDMLNREEGLRGAAYADPRTKGSERAEAIKPVLQFEHIAKAFGVDVRTGKGTLKPLGKVLDEIERELEDHK